MRTPFAATLLTLMLILGVLKAPAQAATTATTTITLPFSGSFFDSVTAEIVNISGSVNVTAHTTLGTCWTTDLYTALPGNVSGTGQATGARYVANGAVFQTFEYPSGPIKPVFALVVFKLWPPGPVRAATLDNFVVTFSLDFASDGSLIPQTCGIDSCSGSSIVSIGDTLVSCDPSVEICP